MQRALRWLYPLLAVPLSLACGPLSPEAEELEPSPPPPALVEAEAGLEKLASVPIGQVLTLLNTCGNAGVAPQIVSNTVMSPAALPQNGQAPAGWNPERGRVRRGGYEYVSSDGMRFELVTDGCTYIQEVRLGSRVITPSYTNGYWYSAQASTVPPANPSHQGTNLWVFFPKQPDGAADTLSIVVGRVAGSGTATYHLPLVRVERVEGANVSAPIGFSRTELFNLFGKALYTMFNGATNSTVLTSTDGSRRRIYGYDPKSLQVSLDSAGVSFSFRFKADINNWCDPTVRAHGKFRIDTRQGTVGLEWVNPAQGSLSWPTRCQAVQVVPILGLIPNLIYGVIESEASSSIRGAMEGQIAGALPSVGNSGIFLDGSSSSAQELRIHLKLPVPSIGVRVPYDAYDMGRRPIPFPKGETLALLAHGSGLNDYVANVSPQTTLWSGPNGVPLAGTTNWPNALTLARQGSLVWQSAPVARLLARTTPVNSITLPETVTWQYEPGCAVKIPGSPFGDGTALFGVNDTAANAQASRATFGAAPGYSLRAYFLNDLGPNIADAVGRCRSFSMGGLVLLGNAVGPVLSP